jgi:hypothetical protein
MTLRTVLRDNGARTPDGRRRLIVVGTLEVGPNDLPAGADFAFAGELEDLGEGAFALLDPIVADITGQLPPGDIAHVLTSSFRPDCAKRVQFGSGRG